MNIVEQMKKIKLSNLTPKTVTTLVLAIIAVVNAIARMTGASEIIIPDNQVYDVVSGVFLVVMTIATTWNNCNLTDASAVSQSVLDLLKSGEILAEDVNEMIKSSKEKQS